MPEIFALHWDGDPQFLQVDDGFPRTVHNTGNDPIEFGRDWPNGQPLVIEGTIEPGDKRIFEKGVWLQPAGDTVRNVLVLP